MGRTSKTLIGEITGEKLLDAQMFIQNNLDRDLSFGTLARLLGISPSHFHRLFKAHLGETVKAYVDRLRVEKSLYDIRISDLNLLQIALRYGFKNPETYSRVFKRHFKCPPSHFLKERRLQETPAPASLTDYKRLAGLRRSKDTNFAVTHLKPLHVAFIRSIGSYFDAPMVSDPGYTLWRELEDFTRRKPDVKTPFIYLVIPQDDPETTPVNKQRLDSCVLIDAPFKSRGRIGYQKIEGGYYGVLTHAGPYSSLGGAFEKLFRSALALKDFSIVSSAVFELLVDISVTSIDDHTWTELYVPLKRKNGSSLR